MTNKSVMTFLYVNKYLSYLYVCDSELLYWALGLSISYYQGKLVDCATCDLTHVVMSLNGNTLQFSQQAEHFVAPSDVALDRCLLAALGIGDLERVGGVGGGLIWRRTGDAWLRRGTASSSEKLERAQSTWCGGLFW